MIALLLKDIYNLQRYAKTLLALLVFYGCMAFLGQGAGFISSMIVMILAMLVISSFSYDEYSKWQKYCISLPISRGQMVGSKYLLGVLVIGFGVVLGLAGGGLLTLAQDVSFTEEILPSCLGCGVAALFMLSFILPLIYRFGVEKSRILLLAVVFLPVILILGLAKFAQEQGIAMPSESTILLLMKIIPFIALGCYLISYFISTRILKQKEL